MTRRTLIYLAAVSIGLTPIASSAQDALGTGRALDNNLNTQSGGRNFSQRSIQSEVQLRNALLTGNVAGGRQFRGNVGYSAPLDFRNPTGSDDIFQFQTDSFYSGLATQNLRNIGGIQNSFSRSTLGQVGTQTGQFVIDRPNVGSASGSFDAGRSTALDNGEDTGIQRDRAGSSAARLDPFGSLDGTLRSTSAYFLRGSERPQILRVSEGDTRTGLPRATIASPLQGVRNLNVTDPSLGYDRMSEESPESIRDSFRNLGREGEQEAEETDRPGRMDPHQMIVDRLDTRIRNMDRSKLSERNTQEREDPSDDPFSFETDDDDDPGEDAPDDRESTTGMMLESLRDDLTRSAVEFRDLMRDRQDRQPARDDDADDDEDADEDADQEADEDEPSEYQHERVIERAVELLGGERVNVDSLLDTENPQSSYQRHMAEGQKALKEGRWFDAEERFTAALQARQDAPLASAGRINAQIGAGMYRSAALNLRALYRTYPEMVSVRFDAGLLPTAERLTKIRDQLRERMRGETAFSRNAGLLLAYLGFQFESPADIKEGFGVVERVDKALGVDRDPLDVILRRVWGG